MKKKISTGFMFCFFLAVLSFNTSAQEFKYDLNKYFTPDIVRNSLDLNFNSNGNFENNTSQPTTPGDPHDSISSSNLSGSIQSIFRTTNNTRKHITDFSLIGNLSGYTSSNKDNRNQNNVKNTGNDASESINPTYTSTLYNLKKQFIRFGGSLNFYNYNEIKTNEYNSNKTKSNNDQLFFNANVSIGIGVGRIEQVADARQAIYILEELSKKGVLSRHLSDDEIFKLSQQVSRVKNKRFLDSRLHLIDEISSIDSFFVANNLLNKQDATYFTTLNDLWQNGANFSRGSGHVFQINLMPFMDINTRKNQTTFFMPDSIYWNKSNLSSKGAYVTLSYNYEKAVNLNWQHSVDARLWGSSYLYNQSVAYSTDQLQEPTKSNQSNLNLSGKYSIGYYPNTRTYLTAGITQYFQVSYAKNYDSTIFDSKPWQKQFSSTTELNCSVYYYISSQLRLSGSASLRKYYSEYPLYNNNRLNGSFSANLSYSFF
ncbi:MAG: hypothetical protein PHT07_11970 [Paludibacter sp.]|nr:hypothetical protein [Paludibacter sp.]